MQPTALHDVHVDHGATMTDFAGWAMPLRYRSEVIEHHTVRNRAGLFDLSHMGEISVIGPAAGEELDWALVNKPSAMKVGKAGYTMIVGADGGVIDDLVVYRLGVEEFLVVANASNVDTVAAELATRARGRDVIVRDASADWALLAVQGPSSASVVEKATAQDVTGLKYYSIAPGRVNDRAVWLARTGYTGEDGFEIYCPPADAVAIWNTFLDVGVEFGLAPAGLACRDSLRLEAGMPLYGNELTRDLTPYDVGLGRIVKFDKPHGFIGAPALKTSALEASVDGPRHSLVGVQGTGRRAARSGHVVLDPETGHRVGVVTSGAPSPTLGYPVAMVLLDGPALQAGHRLVVDVRGKREDVVVVDLPFYSRPR